MCKVSTITNTKKVISNGKCHWNWLFSKWIHLEACLCRRLIKKRGDCSWGVIVDNPVDPVTVVPHFGVDSREVWVSATDTPGDNALEEAIADKGTTGVTLWITKRNQTGWTNMFGCEIFSVPLLSGIHLFAELIMYY